MCLPSVSKRLELNQEILFCPQMTFFQNQVVVFQVHACTVSVKEFRSGSRNSFFEYSQHLFWMRNKENSFTLHSHI